MLTDEEIPSHACLVYSERRVKPGRADTRRASACHVMKRLPCCERVNMHDRTWCGCADILPSLVSLLCVVLLYCCVSPKLSVIFALLLIFSLKKCVCASDNRYA